MKIKSAAEFYNLCHQKFSGIAEHCDGHIELSTEGDYWIVVFKNGVFHNENGPAVIWLNGGFQYYINGQFCSENQWKKMKNVSKRKPNK
jgi:hypothetical protein